MRRKLEAAEMCIFQVEDDKDTVGVIRKHMNERNTRGKQRIRKRYSWRIRYFGVTEGRIIRKKEAIQRKSRQKNY